MSEATGGRRYGRWAHRWGRAGWKSGVLVVLAVLVLLLCLPPAAAADTAQDVPLSRVADEARHGNVKSITIMGNDVQVVLNDGTELRSRKEDGVSLSQVLSSYGVEPQQMEQINLSVRQAQGGMGDWLTPLMWLLPLLFIVGLFFMLRQPQGGASDSGQAMSFAKSRARRIVADRPTVKFDDVAGVDEAKQELVEVVEFLKHPQKFAALGARIPKGLLLVGPPGTGKTLLARAVAGEAGVPFFSISGSEFVELFVGVGAARVRDLFEQAKRNAPCIIFIDEIDAVGRQRGIGLGGGNDEREQTLNQILVEMDGFDARSNVIVIAATNRPDILDVALLRPGRFDRRVALENPDVEGREAILRIHARGKPMSPDVDLRRLAKQTTGLSGADLENVVNEAAILAARRNRHQIMMADLEEAVERVIAGPEKKSRLISEKEHILTAYHEAGHALVAYKLPNVDPVHKISIVARGMSGGQTRLLPSEDRHLWTRSQLNDSIAFALGGLAAEELVLGETTTGPSNDLEQATRMARRMVVQFGMSEKIGPVVFGGDASGMPGTSPDLQAMGSDTANQIDAEVRRILDEGHERARNLLTEHRHQLTQLAELLLEKETLRGDELEAVLGLPASPQGPEGQPRPRPAVG